MPKLTLPALNIQAPWAELILSRKKAIETRRYPLPEMYRDREVFIIETPGGQKKIKRRVVGIVKFETSFRYKNRQQFYQDLSKHQVGKASKFAWKPGDGAERWGWVISSVRRIEGQVPSGKKCGIVFTRALAVDFKVTKATESNDDQ